MTPLCRWCLDHGRNTPDDPHVYCTFCGGGSAPPDTDAAWESGPRCRYDDCMQGNPVASDDERVTCSECRHTLGLPQLGYKCGHPRREDADCDCSTAVRQVSVHGRDILQTACHATIYPTVPCKFCGRGVSERTAHRHQGSWVGDECCWDERLRATE